MGIYIFTWKVLKEALISTERPAATVISESMSSRIVMTRANDLVHMSTTATGKM